MKQRITALLLALCMAVGLLVLPAGAAAETGATEEHAQALHTLGLFAGTEAGFQLERRPTRVEGLVMFIRLLGAEDEAKFENYPHAFSDVPAWASPYVGYAYYYGLTTGISETIFGSDHQMTAGEYLTFLLRLLGYDDSKGDFAWNTAIDKAVEIGFLTGEEATALQTQPATRGTMVDLSWTALTQPYKEDRTVTLARALVSAGVFTQEQAVQFDLWKEAPKPYLVKTLFRATLSTVKNDIHEGAEQILPQMVLDESDNLIYYDEGAKAIVRRSIQENAVGLPETLLDVKNATYTAQIDGAYVTYRDLDVNQIFADEIHRRILVSGTFRSIDQSANDGWSSNGAPSSYRGTFAVEHGALVFLSSKVPYLHATMADGRYIATRFGASDYTNLPAGTPYLWDLDTGSETELGGLLTILQTLVPVGQDIFSISRVGLEKYDFSTQHLDRIAITLPGSYWETGATARNGLFYFWNPDGVCAVRPNGQQKTLLNPQTDIEVTDLTPMPRVLNSIFVTTGESFLFYDVEAKAVRLVYPNPELEPSQS